MTLADANAWFGILGGLAGALSVLYLVWDSLKKRRQLRLDESNIVTTNAIQLMEQLRLRVTDLDGQLDEANQRADDLAGKLQVANRRADDLQGKHDEMAEDLTNAQAEVRVLRVQVKHLSTELAKYTSGPVV